MGRIVYLDIDMDYFVAPIKKVSIDNLRIYYDEKCELLPVSPLVDGLKKSGLKWNEKDIHCFTNHKKSYIYWWMSKLENCTLIHVDAHSDLYRNSDKDLRKLPNSEMGCYNYIWYAIRDNYINDIYWILPESISHMVNTKEASSIINKNLIKDSYLKDNVLHIIMECIDISGRLKEVEVKVCTIENFKFVEALCKKVTIATSPEFIPESADELIYELFKQFGAEYSMAKNIYNQHKHLLQKPEEEILKAREHLGII